MPIPQARAAAILGSKKAWFRSGFQYLPFFKEVDPHKSTATSHNRGDNLARLSYGPNYNVGEFGTGSDLGFER
jgi:hypothetical protein